MRISDWSSDVCSSDLFGDLDSDRWNVWGALSVKENRILRGVDRDFANSFQPVRGLSPDTRGPPFAPVFNQNGAIIVGSLVHPADAQLRSPFTILDLPAALGCESGADLMSSSYSYLFLSSVFSSSFPLFFLFL